MLKKLKKRVKRVMKEGYEVVKTIRESLIDTNNRVTAGFLSIGLGLGLGIPLLISGYFENGGVLYKERNA